MAPLCLLKLTEQKVLTAIPKWTNDIMLSTNTCSRFIGVFTFPATWLQKLSEQRFSLPFQNAQMIFLWHPPTYVADLCGVFIFPATKYHSAIYVSILLSIVTDQ